ncbi:MFS general substrate transporter, partial [Rhodotorula sp. JG-1b]
DPNKVEWEDDDPHNPQNWCVSYKWIITILCAHATLVVTFASSAPSSATSQVAEQFNSGNEVAELTTALFLAGYVAGPLLWAPLSEMFGRRPIFILTLAVFVLFQIGCALAQNIWTLVICRFFAAVFASSPLVNCGGVIADMWDPIRRGDAMSLFSASVFLGPVLGPIIGGFVSPLISLRWRWIYGWIAFWGLGSWVLMTIFLPETYHPILLKQRAKRMRKENPEEHGDKYAELERADFSLHSIITRTLARPLVMLVVEPIMITVTIYLSVVYGLLYGLFSVIPIIFQGNRGFNPGESGLVFIGVGLGTTIGAAVSVWTQRGYPELLRKWHGHPPPEHRLFGAMLAGPFLIVGIFWLGWTGNYPSIHWAVPAVATIFIGMSFTLVFISFLTYLVEVYLMYSASALSGNTVVRSAVAAAFPLFIRQMFTNLGIGWGASTFGFIGLAITPSPFLFYKYGYKLRQMSRFAPCLDVDMREQVFEEERQEQERKEKDGDGASEKGERTRGAAKAARDNRV